MSEIVKRGDYYVIEKEGVAIRTPEGHVFQFTSPARAAHALENMEIYGSTAGREFFGVLVGGPYDDEDDE